MNEFEYKPTLLILGISSFVGSNLAKYFLDKFRVIGTYHSRPVSFSGVTTVFCDVTKKDQVQRIVQWSKPKYVIYCAGEPSLMECQAFPKISEQRNSSGIVNSLLASDRVGSKFIYLSSSYVHSGDHSVLREADTPLPETVYGHNVSASEFYIQRSSVNYLILRSCPLYGIGNSSVLKNVLETVLYHSAKELPLELENGVNTGFLDVMLLAQTLDALLEKKVVNRLIQVSSKDVMSYFDFAQECARIFKLDEKLFSKKSESFFNTINQNKQNQSGFYFQMDVNNLEEIIGTRMPTIQESLQFTKNNLKF